MRYLAVCVTVVLLWVGNSRAGDAGPVVRALWLVQRYGTDQSVDPRNDQRTKGMLAKALGKENVLTMTGANGLMEPSTFAKLAGPDDKLDQKEVEQALASDTPESRTRLFSQVRAHADLLTTSLDAIDAAHQDAGDKLVEWIVKNYKKDEPLHVTVICTGNSRRSVLGATMGNIAAAYYGMPEIRFHSGGTAPTAVNARTITALQAIGVEIEPTGREARRGEPNTPNLFYKIRWGESGMETTEFSKTYSDPSNPQTGFAALMVCGEADAGCPVVKGAAIRISMAYLDPKIFDGSAYEAIKHAERRDDMGRLMMSVMMRVRNRLGRL
jgi:hypothetical protein